MRKLIQTQIFLVTLVLQEGSNGWKLPLPKILKLTGIKRLLDDWIKPVAGKSLTFTTFGSSGESITFVPLFRSQHNRMTVYWDGDRSGG